MASDTGASPLPERAPFALRGRVMTPLDAGGTAFHADGIVEVDAAGRIAWVGPAGEWAGLGARGVPARGLGAHGIGEGLADCIDVRPLLVMPGMVDLHAHLPQLPTVGLGAGLDLLTWLERYVFPLERRFDDAAAAAVLAPHAFRAFASAGTTTLVAYAAVFAASTDGAFRAAEEHGIRAVLGKVMMDRVTYDERTEAAAALDRSLRESEELCARWHGADEGRLRYAVTPRFAVSCSAEMLRESAALAARTGAYWQTHVSEDRREIAEVAGLFPEALDYVDVYERAGGLGSRAILAHAVHLSDRELARLVATSARVAHCPSSNLFLASGVMPLSRYLEAGLLIGLGSDVAGGPDASIFSVMRVGAYAQNALRALGGEPRQPLAPLDWLRMGTLEGARALGLEDRIGSLEAGKEADIIVVDAAFTAPLSDGHRAAAGPRDARDDDAPDDPSDVMSRLIFRAHPDMVRGAWVRGRRLAGPGVDIEATALTGG